MTKQEIKGAIEYGKSTIEMYKKNGERIPDFVYDRIIELYEELMKIEEEN